MKFFELEDESNMVVDLDKISAIKAENDLFVEDNNFYQYYSCFTVQIGFEKYDVLYNVPNFDKYDKSNNKDLLKKSTLDTQKKAQDKYNYIKEYLLNNEE